MGYALRHPEPEKRRRGNKLSVSGHLSDAADDMRAFALIRVSTKIVTGDLGEYRQLILPLKLRHTYGRFSEYLT